MRNGGKMNICIYGAARDRIDHSYKQKAWELGQKLAKSSYGIVFGGGATGLMGAAARGWSSVKEQENIGSDVDLIGIAPHFFNRPGVLFEGCTKFIWTETMHERKYKMEELADVFVVLPGGIGTFEEFLETLTLRQLKQHDKPIFLYNINGYYDQIQALFTQAVKEHFMEEEQKNLYCCVKSADEIIEQLNLLKKIGNE